MKLTIQSRSGRTISTLSVDSGVRTVREIALPVLHRRCRPASLSPQDSVLELKRQLHAAKRSLYPERQRLTLPPKTGEARGAVLEDDKRLAEYGLKDGDAVLFKDLGPQVSTMTAWRRG